MWSQVKAVGKFVLSFRKGDWNVHDYPLRFIDRGPVEAVGRLKPLRWTAQIVNWLQMRGDADTREAALEDLRQKLDRYRAERGSLPRPGTGRKLEVNFAATDRIDANQELVADILRQVMGVELEDCCFVSNESTLWDFHHDEDNGECYRRITAIYGVDVSDIEPPSLAAIAERIRQRRAG